MRRYSLDYLDQGVVEIFIPGRLEFIPAIGQ